MEDVLALIDGPKGGRKDQRSRPIEMSQHCLALANSISLCEWPSIIKHLIRVFVFLLHITSTDTFPSPVSCYGFLVQIHVKTSFLGIFSSSSFSSSVGCKSNGSYVVIIDSMISINVLYFH